MKKNIAIAFSLIFLWAGSASAVMLSFQQSSLAVDVGTSFSVDLIVSQSNPTAVISVGEFDIDVLYDPTQMAFTGWTLDTFLGDSYLDLEAMDLSWGDMGGGVSDLAELSLLLPDELNALQSDSSFRLASLGFECLAAGQSIIALDAQDPYLVVGDGLGNALPLDLGPGVEVTQGGTAPVPEPATMLLFGTGLAGFAGNYLRKQKKA